VTVLDDNRRRYEAALARYDQVRQAWEDEGSPMTATGGATGRSVVVHPLLALLNQMDALCDRLGKSVGARTRTRQEPGRMSDAGDELTELSPAAKLRVAQ
jgi:hypothetical protein